MYVNIVGLGCSNTVLVLMLYLCRGDLIALRLIKLTSDAILGSSSRLVTKLKPHGKVTCLLDKKDDDNILDTTVIFITTVSCW